MIRKKIITYEEYLQIEGLLVLRKEVNNQINYIQKAVADLVGAEEEMEGYYGHVSDYMWEETGAKTLLNNLGIKIKKERKNGKTKKSKWYEDIWDHW